MDFPQIVLRKSSAFYFLFLRNYDTLKVSINLKLYMWLLPMDSYVKFAGRPILLEENERKLCMYIKLQYGTLLMYTEWIVQLMYMDFTGTF